MHEADRDRTAWFATLRQDLAYSDKNWYVAFFLSMYLGWCGADRFYLGSGLLGMLKFFTLGGLGMWWLIDLILLIIAPVRDGERKRLRKPWGKQQ